MDEKLDKIADIVAKQHEFKNEFTTRFLKEAILAIKRFDEKHTEKGFGNYNEFGPLGVIVKMSDPYNELKNAYMNPAGMLPLETLDKDWTDIAVYALIGKLISDGNWKE